MPWMQDRFLPYSKDGTSKEAASTATAKAEQQRNRVLAFISIRGSSTCDEVEVGLGLPHQSASARINELHRSMGVIEVTDERRPTRTGCMADVYRVVPDGVEQRPPKPANWKKAYDDLLFAAKKVVTWSYRKFDPSFDEAINNLAAVITKQTGKDIERYL